MGRRNRRRQQQHLKATQSEQVPQLTSDQVLQHQFEYHQAAIPWQPCLNVATGQQERVLFVAPVLPTVCMTMPPWEPQPPVPIDGLWPGVVPGPDAGMLHEKLLDILQERESTTVGIDSEVASSHGETQSVQHSSETQGDDLEGPCMLFPPTPEFTPPATP